MGPVKSKLKLKAKAKVVAIRSLPVIAPPLEAPEVLSTATFVFEGFWQVFLMFHQSPSSRGSIGIDLVPITSWESTINATETKNVSTLVVLVPIVLVLMSYLMVRSWHHHLTPAKLTLESVLVSCYCLFCSPSKDERQTIDVWPYCVPIARVEKPGLLLLEGFLPSGNNRFTVCTFKRAPGWLFNSSYKLTWVPDLMMAQTKSR